MISSRFVGIFWALVGLGVLVLAVGREPRNTPLLVVGVVLVALGAALIRRAGRRRRPGRGG